MSKANETISKNDLIEKISTNNQIPKQYVKKTLDLLPVAIQEELEKGNKVQLLGFGTFETRERKERNGVDPRTGQPKTIPAATVPAFKFSTKFKDYFKKK